MTGQAISLTHECTENLKSKLEGLCSPEPIQLVVARKTWREDAH